LKELYSFAQKLREESKRQMEMFPPKVSPVEVERIESVEIKTSQQVQAVPVMTPEASGERPESLTNFTLLDILCLQQSGELSSEEIAWLNKKSLYMRTAYIPEKGWMH